MPCFIVGQMKALSYSQMSRFSLAQSTFIRINEYNKTIVTKRVGGDKTASYYTFKEGEEVLYKQGQFLLSQNDPTNVSLYQSVAKL